MALLDVSKAAQYGLQATWADKLFKGEFTLGSIQVDYWNGCASKDTWGKCKGATQQRNQPATFNSSSTISGSNLSLSGASWLSYNTSPASQLYAIATNANASNPFRVQGVSLQSGNSANGNTNAGVTSYLDNSNFTPGSISFINNGNQATITPGTVTATSSQLASGANAAVTFTFLPGATPVLSLTYSASNTVTSSTTNGTVNSSSNTQQASVNISNTTKVGGKVMGVGVENETTISAGWTGTWATINEVNFSKSQGTEASTSTTVAVTVDLSNLKPNADGTYNYTSPSPTVGGSPQSGAPQTTANFIPGQKYTAAIQLNQANVQNIVNGTYSIAGTVGSIKDSFGNTVSLTAAQAIKKADSASGPSVLNYPAGGLGSLDPSQTSIPFNGSSVFSTSLQYNFSVNYYAVGTPNQALVSTKPASSLGLKNLTGSVLKYDLGLINKLTQKAGTGTWLALQTLDGDLSKIVGSGNNNVVVASATGNHEFVDHKDSFLIGNDQADKYMLDAKAINNKIEAKAGDDSVVAASSQQADLGIGNDSYTITGGKDHKITLGTGKDVVNVNTEDANFNITDFDFLEDKVVASGAIKNKKVTYKIDYHDHLKGNRIEGASLDFFVGNKKVGSATLDIQSEVFKAFTDPKKYLELAMLNSNDFKFDDIISHIQGKPFPSVSKLLENQSLFDTAGNTTKDWSSWDNTQRGKVISSAMNKLGSKLSAQEWTTKLQSLAPSSIEDFSIDMVTNQLWPLAGVSPEALARL